jgi:hypothetical protein
MSRSALGMLALFLCGAALSAVLAPSVVQAQVPDSGLQRVEMLHELRESNKKLGEIATLLGEIRDLQAKALAAAPAPGRTADTKPAALDPP